MGKAIALQIRQLAIGYRMPGKMKRVAEDLSAGMYEGELVCLLGANGTGKSTLLRTLCGFQPFFEGEIRIRGRSIRQLREKELSLLVSVVLTERILLPHATVSELVAYGRSPYTGLLGKANREDMQIVEQAMFRCGIAHKKEELLSALSDGERQKAFIAKALAQDTPVILLDEPTAFLDLPARVEIIQLLREIAFSSGKSVLLSTHDLDLALQMADRLWLLHHGGPLVTGSPEDLLLQNAFQPMFERKGIEFDNRSGLFRVTHTENRSLAIKGHGFGYVLLRRAFARKGIRLDPRQPDGDMHVEITSDEAPVFSLFCLDKCVFRTKQVEAFVEQTVRLLESQGMISEINLMTSGTAGYDTEKTD